MLKEVDNKLYLPELMLFNVMLLWYIIMKKDNQFLIKNNLLLHTNSMVENIYFVLPSFIKQISLGV